MPFNRSIEAMAVVVAVTLLLFTPMIDPIVSLLGAILLVGVLFLILAPSRTHHFR